MTPEVHGRRPPRERTTSGWPTRRHSLKAARTLTESRIDPPPVEGDVDARVDGVAEEHDPAIEGRPARAGAARSTRPCRRRGSARRRARRRARAPPGPPPSSSQRARVTSSPPAAPAAARPSRGTRRGGRSARSTRRRSDRDRAARARAGATRAAPRSPGASPRPPSSSAGRATTRPVSGSRSGTTIPLTSGKLCSQTGSWITTGTTSQRCSTAVSQVSRDGGTMKSESTKTKLPAETIRRCSKRCSRPRSTPSAGAVHGAVSSRSSRTTATRRSPRGGSQNGSPSAKST